MKLYLLILLMATVYAGELEVEGNLSVTEGVTATAFVGDGSGLTNLPSLGGIQPERIYRYTRVAQDTPWSFTVPNNKFWILSSPISNTPIIVNATIIDLKNGSSLFLLQGDNISDGGCCQIYNLNILEYPISGSGTDQGMDYIEP